ncbi:MAG TPA: uroporphyrinogen-III synthase, partial [Mizugakiibacter sp.]
ETARRALRAALRADVAVFTSPAAVRHAARLAPLRFARATTVIGVGAGTARALHRAGVARALHPATRQDSAGALMLPGLENLRGRRVALIGAPGGRGVLDEALVCRGATLLHAHVYRRVPPRLTRRHLAALAAVRGPLYVLLSSAEALAQLRAALPPPAWSRFVGGVAVVSSARLAAAARRAGFAAIAQARSALAADLLAAAVAAHAKPARLAALSRSKLALRA